MSLRTSSMGVDMFLRDLLTRSGLSMTDRDRIETLFALGTSKAAALHLGLEDALRHRPGSALVHPFFQSRSDVRGYSAHEAASIPGEVRRVLEQLVRGTDEVLLDGLARLISGLLVRFLSRDAGHQEVTEGWLLADGSSLIRLDLRAFYQRVRVDIGIERIVAVAAVRSVIDLDALDFDGFRERYLIQLADMELSESDIAEAVEKARRIYERTAERGAA